MPAQLGKVGFGGVAKFPAQAKKLEEVTIESASSPTIRLNNTNFQGYVDLKSNSIANTDFDIQQNGTSRVYVDPSGGVGIGTTIPTHKLHVVGSQNLTGTLYYGALQSQSPHALVQRGARGQLEPTEICIVTTAGNVLSVKFNDLGAALTSINSTSCMEKQTLESVEFIYNETLQQNVTIEHRRYVFR